MMRLSTRQIQRGDQPDDFKPMPAIGKGVEEIRVSDSSGACRVIYLARRAEAIYVLHAFHKKIQATPRKDLLKSRKHDLGNCWEEGYEQT
jgi:phage-related protein